MRIILTLLLSSLATASGAFEGSYFGQDQTLEITKSSSGRYVLNLEVATSGCQGDVIAKGRAKGKTLTATFDDAGTLCTFTVKKTKRGLSVSEQDCWGTHGAACSYDGDYVQR